MPKGSAPDMDDGPIPRPLRLAIKEQLEKRRGPGHHGELTKLAERVGCTRQNLDKIAEGKEWSVHVRRLCEELKLDYLLYAGLDEGEYKLLMSLKHVRAASGDEEHFIEAVEKKAKLMVDALAPVGAADGTADAGVVDESPTPPKPQIGHAPLLTPPKRPTKPGRPGPVRARSSSNK